VKYKPVNDLVVEHRKISGTGAGEIGDAIVFVGNLILDFDYEMMSRVLKIPDEKFRDKVKKTIEENLSTIKKELPGSAFDSLSEIGLNRMMAEAFEGLLGPMNSVEIDPVLIEKMKDVQKTMMDDAWLFQRGRRKRDRAVKVRSGLEVFQRMHKAPGGLIRAEFYVDNGKYKHIEISGDFFCFPSDTVDNLAAALDDCPVEALEAHLMRFYQEEADGFPGVAVEDWVNVFKL
jgi:lipoate-protein ligase A